MIAGVIGVYVPPKVSQRDQATVSCAVGDTYLAGFDRNRSRSLLLMDHGYLDVFMKCKKITVVLQGAA